MSIVTFRNAETNDKKVGNKDLVHKQRLLLILGFPTYESPKLVNRLGSLGDPFSESTSIGIMSFGIKIIWHDVKQCYFIGRPTRITGKQCLVGNDSMPNNLTPKRYHSS